MVSDDSDVAANCHGIKNKRPSCTGREGRCRCSFMQTVRVSAGYDADLGTSVAAARRLWSAASWFAAGRLTASGLAARRCTASGLASVTKAMEESATLLLAARSARIAAAGLAARNRSAAVRLAASRFAAGGLTAAGFAAARLAAAGFATRTTRVVVTTEHAVQHFERLRVTIAGSKAESGRHQTR